MKFIKYTIIALFFAACHAEPEMIEEITPLVHTRASSLQFTQTENINLKELGIIRPSKLIRKDSLYIILTPKSKYCFAIYNNNTGKLKRFVPAGSGENEGLYFLTMNLNGNTVSSFDFGTGRLVELDLTRYATEGYTPEFTPLATNGKNPLGALRAGNQLISTGMYTEGRYRCTNPATGDEYFSVPYPECAGTSMSDSLKSIFYASNCMVVNSSNTRLACANMQYGCLDLCDIEGNTLNRVNEIHLNRPGITVQHKRPRSTGIWYPIAYTKHNLFGFCDLTTSDDYIFALYSGRTYRQYKGEMDKGRIILVFDWNGTHVRTYHLPNTCSSISYDKTTNSIYALSQEKGKAEIITLNL